MEDLLLIAAADLPGEHSVSAAVTGLFACLLVGLIACLALEEKLHAKKSVIAGVFAIVCLVLGTWFQILPFEEVVIGSHRLQSTVAESIEPEVATAELETAELHEGGEEIRMPVYVPAIDWSVIAIILGSSLFVDVVSRSGLFTWIAIRLTKASGGDPLLLLCYYGVMTVVFSAVLNNVTAMIIVGSLSVVSLDKLGRRHQLLGFLLIEGMLTNVGGLLTLISSVPNIIVGTTAKISFVTFFLKSSPYVVVATALTILMGAKLVGIRRLKTEEERKAAGEMVAGFDENDGIESAVFFWFGAIMTGLFIATIASASVLPIVKDLGMGFVALAFGGIVLIRYKSVADKFYQALDWDLLGFFMALFVVINVMEHAQVLHAIGQGMRQVISLDAPGRFDEGVLLVGAAAFSSVTDNIPLSAMLANILGAAGTPSDSGLWWSVIFGANLGGNLTPIGSASTLVAVTIMHRHELSISFGQFIRVAFPYAAAQIVLALFYVLIFLT